MDGVTGEGPLGPTINEDKQWIFPNVKLTEVEKRMILAEVMRLVVEVLFKTHCYSFKGSVFRQNDGGPIGLRATCAIARVVMVRHSQKWREVMVKSNMMVVFDGFYVDDGRMIVFALRPGWRWCDNGLWFCEEWALEDQHKTPTERTKEAIMGSMGGLVECLSFTVESGEEFEEGWLPTLDLSLKMSDKNQVMYKFFEKPTASRMCLQADTALGQSCLVQSLVQDIIRRMLNCSEHVNIDDRREVIDNFGQKMINSGHSVEEARRNVVSGLKGWKSKVERSKTNNTPLHRSASESSGSRRFKKLVGKSSWFKNKKSDESLEESLSNPPSPSMLRMKNSNQGWVVKDKGNMEKEPLKDKDKTKKVDKVEFVEHTRGGSLALSMRK